jgi:hypothetical protein
MRFLFAVGIAALSGCVANKTSFGTNAAYNAAIATATGIAAAGISRASGGCYANCPPGTACNSVTGFCEELPCRGLCSTEEHCEMTPTSWKCMPGRSAPTEIQIGRTPIEGPATQPGDAQPSAPLPSPKAPGEGQPTESPR